MKITKILISGLFIILFSGVVFGQTVTYSAAESLFDDSQKEIMDKAEKYIEMGNKKIKQAETIEDKYKKPEKKKKKKKKKKKASKFDKKTWEAKKFRIQAERDFLKGYEAAITVYSEIIVAANFYDTGDESEANALNDDAVDLIAQADKDMSRYNKMTNDKKTLKKLPSSSLKSAISKSNSKKKSAYEKQKEALDLVLAQGRKKEEKERDDRAWQNAQDINTIASYQDYIDNFSSGKYVNKARQMIRQLKAEEERNRTSVVSDYIFMVQIAASKNTLGKYTLAAKYNNTNEIKRVYIDYYYKYRVGDFTNYNDAAALRDRLLRSTVPDAFIVVFDKNGNQIEVTDGMKN